MKVIKQAFKGSMIESKDKVFSMEVWNTENVLDVIECLYTGSFLHLSNSVEQFMIAHIIIFLDVPGLGLKLIENISSKAKISPGQKILQDYILDIVVSVWILREELVSDSPKIIANFCQLFSKNINFTPEHLGSEGNVFIYFFYFWN